MKKELLILYLLAITFLASAQNVGINNTGATPDASAMLDVKSNNKGLLIPRVALASSADNTTIPAATTSLLIYNTASAGSGTTAVTPGFYFWNGTAWVRLITDGTLVNSGWLIGGNAGTNPSSHFLGTTDNNSLMFKVNNQKAGYIGVGINDGNVFWGYQSGTNNSTGFSNVGIGIKTLFNNSSMSNLVAIGDSALFNNTTGFNNTAIGSKSLFNNTTGGLNSAYGIKALYSNIGGAANTAIGYQALNFNSTGNSNVGIGMNALYNNTTGTDNTANGAVSLYQNTSGSYNSANGSLALYNNTSGNYNTSTGYQALYSNTTGSWNTANGLQSLYSNTTGNSNTAVAVDALRSNTTGSANTANGYQSLYQNTTGNYNTAIGVHALFSDTSGSYNTANGNDGLYFNSSGNNNTSNGYQALYSNTTGSWNTANGSNALENNSTGNYNTANGYSALFSNSTGFFNTANGSGALGSNSVGNYNTANGNVSLYHNISGINNTANGYQALYNNSTGSNNSANGINALYSNTIGNLNTASGVSALASNTIGNNNTANGVSALFFNDSGNENTAEGYRALYSNVTGYSNIAIGVKALYSNIVGHNMVAIGDSALYNNNTSPFLAQGASNNAVGSKALFANTTGNSNEAFGANALNLNTTGFQNSAMGSWSLSNNTQGFLNTALGDQTMLNNTTGGYNTAVGGGSGYFNSTGNYNSFIGCYTGPSIGMTNLTNATAIGAQAQVSCSNCMVLGSVNGVNGAVSSVNVGIGMNNPSNRLYVFNGTSGGSPFTAFQTPLVVENNDQTYINLLSPEAKETGILFGKPSNAASGVIVYNNVSTPNGFQFRDNGNITRMAIDNTGNVGIGTVAPFAYGHGGNNRITEINNPNTGSDIQSHVILSTSGTSGSTGGITWASLNVPGTEKRLGFIGDVYETSNAARMVFYTRSESAILGERLTILGSGNVGIGTPAPGFLLEVNGTAGKPGGGSWSVTSDARMKEKVTPYTDGLSALLRINPVKYHYNQLSGYDTKPEYVGVLAQDIRSIAPYMVGSFQKNGEAYYNVDNSAMTYMLINAVKEQQKQIDELKKLVEKLVK